MKVNVQSVNFNVDQKLVVFIQEKLDKLEQFYDKIIFADVFLKVQHTSEKENKITEVLLSISGDELMVKKNTKTLIAPILQKRLADQLEQNRLKME